LILFANSTGKHPMFERYLILLDANTTAGGTVTTATSFMSYDAVPYALEGDLVNCPACGKRGTIKCVPPRLHASCDGKQYALEHDLCLCACSPPPRLIANQHHNCQTIHDDQGIADALEAVASRVPASAAREAATPLQLVRESNDQPFRSRHYILELPGRKIEGVTDADGFTQPLTDAERAALIAWHVENDPEPAA
jgi:uncharacterized Zn-binding protein involved in type VI secretion